MQYFWLKNAIIGLLLGIIMSFCACLTGAKAGQTTQTEAVQQAGKVREYKPANVTKADSTVNVANKTSNTISTSGTSVNTKPLGVVKRAKTTNSTGSTSNYERPADYNYTDTAVHSGNISPTPNIISSSSYDISILLPFSAMYYRSDGNMDSLPKQSVRALEFYEGVLVGLDYLRNKNVPLNVTVYDTEKKASKAQQITSSPNFSQSDLIIGPIYNKPLKEVARYAQQHQIYQVSPLSPSTKIATNNPYYLVASPSVETHCEAMYDYFSQTGGSKRVLTVCGNSLRENDLAKLFQRLSMNTQAEGNYLNVAHLTHDYMQTEKDMEAYLSPSEKNIIVITSSDELVINDVTRKLNMLRGKYDITLYGMPNWKRLNNLPFDYLANLNYHTSSNFWLDKYSTEHQNFKRDYYAKFNNYPSDNAAKGFDLMLHFGELINQYGNSFGYYLTNGTGVYSNFNFVPTIPGYHSNSVVANPAYLENKAVHILRYTSNYSFEKVK